MDVKSNKSYRKLILWKRLTEFLKFAYKLISKLPKEEDFGLKSQMRRAAVSVLSNFAEGYLKRSMKDKLRFLEISNTSLLELEAQGEICLILGYWSESDYNMFETKKGEVGYLLYRYSKSVV